MPLDMLSTELQMLTWSAVLCFAQVVVAVLTAGPQVGLVALAGNRANLPPLTGIAQRAQRAHLNMLENLALFAILVLVAVVGGRTNEMTALGAQIFLWARVAYAVIYLIGIPWVRTGAWVVSVVGMVMILLQIVTQ
jgi:uncharacterized MAPEG superfamily protein